MPEKGTDMEQNLKKGAIAMVLVFLMALSAFPLAAWASSQQTHAATIASIDDKVQTVLKLTATSTIASAGISAIPGDTATPIAGKMADFTEYFLLVLCVLYSEKYLLSIIGTGIFRMLIPLALGILLFSLFREAKESWRILAVKLIAFGLALFAVIPASVRVSDMVYETYNASIQRTIEEAEDFTQDTSALTRDGDASFVAAILEKLSTTAADLSNRAARIMNNFIESLAVMIVTACMIPVLVLLFFIWVVKMLTGIQLTLPERKPRPLELHS